MIAMKPRASADIADVISAIPNRVALAGGWIDQPFVSRHNPTPPGSMVVVALEPTFRLMDRAAFATGTRYVAMKHWNGRLPDREPADLVKELYAAENEGKADPSGSQDMIGLIYPGVNRLDYDIRHEGGVFPCRIESNNDPGTVRWLQRVIHLLPVNQRPEGYSPLSEAGPWVYWMFLENVMSKEEITRELEEMAAAGLAGAEMRFPRSLPYALIVAAAWPRVHRLCKKYRTFGGLYAEGR